MDCHRPSAFAMTNGTKSDEFFFFFVFALTFCGLWIASSFYSSQWRRGGKWWFVDCFALLAITVHPHRHCEGRRPVAISLFLASHCETSQKEWQSRYSWLVIARVACNSWQSHYSWLVIARLWKIRGNLSIATTIPNPYHHCESS